MNTTETARQFETAKPKEMRIGVFSRTVSEAGLNSFLYEMANSRVFASLRHTSDCGLSPNWRHFQAMLISTASQKRMEATERRTVIEDVV